MAAITRSEFEIRTTLGIEGVSLLRSLAMPEAQQLVPLLRLPDDEAKVLIDGARTIDAFLWNGVEPVAAGWDPLVSKIVPLVQQLAPTRSEANFVLKWHMWIFVPFNELCDAGRGPQLIPHDMTSLRTLITQWRKDDLSLERHFPVLDGDEEDDDNTRLRILSLWEAIRWRNFTALWSAVQQLLDPGQADRFVVWARGLAAHDHASNLPMPEEVARTMGKEPAS